jgi:hypothetical protein
MAITSGDGGSAVPAPTDSGVCSISPSDLVGYTGNALNRIKDLEDRVAELEAKIVQANQLSDLSQQVGWVGGVEYMGVGGWTQTEYRTLIPPQGWTLAGSGIIPNLGPGMQLVYTDTNGNIFSADDFTAGGAPDYLLYDGLYTINESRNIATLFNTFALNVEGTTSGEIVAQVSKAGLYLVNVHGSFHRTSGTAPATTVFSGLSSIIVSPTPNAQLTVHTDIQTINSVVSQVIEPGGGTQLANADLSRVVKVGANETIRAGVSCIAFPEANMPANMKTNEAVVSITRLGSYV